MRHMPLCMQGAETGERQEAGSEKQEVKTLSIVIITKDTKDLLEDLLISIELDTPLQPFLAEVVVIDNGSSDGTTAMVQETFPTVALVLNGENRGFAASANEGIRRTKGDFVLFLNSDTILIKGEVSKMVRFMADNDEVGICGPQLVYPDMRLQRSVAAIPSLISEVLPFKAFGLSKSNTQHSTLNTALDVPSLIGAAIMARRKALDLTAGFDERFFFFLEETDLCIRMKRAGFRIVLFPSAQVIHLQGKTVRRNWIRGRMEYNISMYKFIGKHYSAFYYRCFQTVRLLKVSLFLSVTTILPVLLFGQRTRRTYSYYVRFVRWHLDGCPDNAGLRTDLHG
jgi:N-acetylglucosaminyl-diphospho-decaprenol L-rhamnosyltransferase